MFRADRHAERTGDPSLSPRRRRITYSNVAATLALVLALGAGSAYAAHRFLITSPKQIKPSVLRSLKVPGPKGTTGPSGATGATGTTGAPGVARDAGAVAANSQGGPSFYTEGLVGWQSVTTLGTGEYCLTPDASSTTANTTLVLSTGNGSGTGAGVAYWDGYCDHPDGQLGLEVITDDLTGTAVNDVGFVAVIPAS